MGDNQLGVFDSSNNPRDLIGVPIFSTATTYVAGQAVNYQGILYIAKQAISAAAFNVAQWFQPTQPVVLGGLLTSASATLLRFGPYKGNYVKIAGVLYPIPTNGIAGLGNTNVFVNSVGGRNLSANATYLVCVFNNAGVLTADFLTGYTHSQSGAAGNEGTEIPFLSSTPIDNRSVIGLAFSNASGQFVNGLNIRGVRSWFNEGQSIIAASPNFSASGITSTTAFSAMESGVQITTWANEIIDAGFFGYSYNNSIGQQVYTAMMVDSTTPGGGGSVGFSYNTSDSNNSFGAAAPHITIAMSEGTHLFQASAFVSGGSGTVTGYTRAATFKQV
jgi:hypothetical protein